MWQRSQAHAIPQSTEVSEAGAVAEVMIVCDAVENTEAKILTLTVLRALSMTSSETAGSSDSLELPGIEEKKTPKDEKKKKKKKGQHNFSQNGNLFSVSRQMKLS